MSVPLEAVVELGRRLAAGELTPEQADAELERLAGASVVDETRAEARHRARAIEHDADPAGWDADRWAEQDSRDGGHLRAAWEALREVQRRREAAPRGRSTGRRADRPLVDVRCPAKRCRVATVHKTRLGLLLTLARAPRDVTGALDTAADGTSLGIFVRAPRLPVLLDWPGPGAPRWAGPTSCRCGHDLRLCVLPSFEELLDAARSGRHLLYATDPG